MKENRVLINKYSDEILEIYNANDMDYGDKTGAIWAILNNLINDLKEIK